MSKVDWSLAPEGATHYNKNNKMFYVFCGDHFKFFCNDGELSYGGLPGEYLAMEKRPKQPQAWSGPEDGLPPVGTVCEHKRAHEWQQVEVFAVKPNYNGSNTALFTYGNGCWGGCAEPSFFRAILTPEQFRESAIRELMDIAQVDCRVTAARLVDAGFKR